MAKTWFAYDSIGNPYAFTSYRKQSSSPACLNGQTICAIYADDNGSTQPAGISANLQQYIANGLSNNIAEPSVPAGSKFYVYLKSLSR